MKIDLLTKLRIEQSKNCSGRIFNEQLIRQLKESHYYVSDIKLDGDAPKQFIKLYQYREDSGVLKKNTKSWDAYIAKTAEKWYPHESIIEFMINRIGQTMGLHMNEVELIRINRQIRFLSKYFLNRNETLVHGAEICGQHLDDVPMALQIANDQKSSRQLFTFEFICQAIRSVFPGHCEDMIGSLVSMVAFDAVVGNNDRHFYNWGIIIPKKRTAQPPKFAPLYDSARGLFWNVNDEKILSRWYDVTHAHGRLRFDKYVLEACPRISIEGDEGINHFGLIEFLKNHKFEYKVLIEEVASVENEARVLEMLNKEFYRYFIKERCELITLVLHTRFKKVRDI